MVKFKVLYVEWIDAAVNGSWTDIDCKTIGIDHCQSIGFLIKETKQEISLCSAVSEKQANAIISIPKAWIKYRKTIRLK